MTLSLTLNLSLKIFDKQLTNPNSKIIWYGELPKSKISLSSRIAAKKTFLPSEKNRNILSYGSDLLSGKMSGTAETASTAIV